MKTIRPEDECLHLAECAIRELRKELRKRMKQGLASGVFPVCGSAQGRAGKILVAMEWKP